MHATSLGLAGGGLSRAGRGRPDDVGDDRSRADERLDAMTQAEFDDFYAASLSRLVGQLYVMTGDRAEAQDAVQEAFVRAWQRRSQFSAARNPEAWIRTVAWRVAASRFRRLRRGFDLLVRQRHEHAVSAPSEVRPVIVDALRRIPEAQRRAIVLHYLCDLPVQEVAAETDAPVGTVKARLARGRAALAPHLSDLQREHS
jgi:RNA polymerase sigma-70 factor, ECF subfamily